MRVRTGLAAAGLLVLLLGAAASAQPTTAELLQRIQDLETHVRIQRGNIQRLEGQASNQNLAAQFQQKLDALRDELQAEIAAASAADGAGGGPLDFRVYWGNGLRLDSRDGSVKLKLGGRLMYDMALFCQGDLDENDGAEVRRARLYASGAVGKHTEFKLQFDFAGGDAGLKDAYLKFKNVLGLDAITVGHFNEPFTMEEPMSSKYIPFMERSLPVEAFSFGRNWGLMAEKTLADKRLLLQAGVFGSADDYGEWNHADDAYNYALKAVYVPVYEDKGKKLLHLGASWGCEVTHGSSRFRTRPEAHLADRLVDTHSFDSEHSVRWGAEVAAVLDSFWFQGEYIAVIADAPPGGDDADFCGFYAGAGYFLTGEHRGYKLGSGNFDRVKVLRPFSNGQGPGAWELAARYSYVDLTDGSAGILGGRLSDVTVGVNWYPNNNMRVMLNYVCATDHADEQTNHILQWRLQVDF